MGERGSAETFAAQHVGAAVLTRDARSEKLTAWLGPHKRRCAKLGQVGAAVLASKVSGSSWAL